MADRRNYNGLHLPGGLAGREPTAEEQARHIRAAFNRELQTLSRDLFVEAVGRQLFPTNPLSVEAFRELGAQCQIAARSYFEGIGVLTVDPSPEPDSTPAE